MKPLEHIIEELKGGLCIYAHTDDCFVSKHNESKQILVGRRANTCLEAANLVYEEYQKQLSEIIK